MARPLRIEYPGAWYHVMNRGRHREKIFRVKKDYQTYFDLIGKCLKFFEFEVHAYSLMPNHYHLLVHTPRGNLSRAMRHLDGVYAQKMNRCYGGEGALFRGRYKAILIHADSYIQEVVRYIHQNAWKAGIEGKIGEHAWTSHQAYLREKGRPSWLQRKFVLKYFGKREKEALRQLDAFVREEPTKGYMEKMHSARWPVVLGNEPFIDWIKEKFLGKRLNEKGIPQLREVLRGEKIAKLKEVAKGLWDCEATEWQKVRRGREDSKRRAMIYVSRVLLKATTREIGQEFGGIGHTGVSMQWVRAEQEMRQKEGCYQYVRELEHALKCQMKT
ncbi:MAG: transposase [Candidatus Omnitrophica bacterium]|nr:transposase [Candidatus Omnitrophota bacterium]